MVMTTNFEDKEM